MARNNERDVELVIRARDEAERALNKITDALLGMSKAQQTVAGTAKGADGAIAALTQELGDLETRLKGLGDMAKVVSGLDKATDSVNRLETEVSQTVSDLERLKQEAQSSAAAVAQAEQKKAAAAQGTKQERQAANVALREAKREENVLARQIEAQNTVLQARIDKLERAKAAYDQLQQSAQRAGAAMGVSPTRESVQSATASTRRQIGDTQGLIDFRSAQQAAEETRKRAEYERFWTQALEQREQQQRETAQAAAQAAAAESRLVQQAEKLKGQLNPLAVAQDRYNKELAEMEVMLERGLIDQKQFAAGQQLITRRLNESKDALDRANAHTDVEFMGLRPYELTNLSYQINDVITGLASGQPVVQILAQQGGQFVQIFGRQLQNLLPTIGRMAPALGGVLAAVLTLGAAFGRVFRQAENLRQFDGFLRATATSAQYTAAQMASLTEEIDRMGLKTDEARNIVRNFIREGVNPANIKAFAEAAKDLADVMGMEVPEAAQLMAEGFTGGYEQIVKLDEQFQFLTATEREQIKAMFDSGRANDARRMAFDRFYKVMDDGAKAMKGPWEQAMSRLGRAWGNVIDAFANTGVIQGLTKLLDDLGRKINEISGALENLTNRFSDQGFFVGLGTAIRDGLTGAGPYVRTGGANSGMSANFVDRVIGAESGGNPNARNPRSSATGAGQFLDRTWIELYRKNFRGPTTGRIQSDEDILALRNNMEISRRMVQLYAEENSKILRAAGVAINDATLYLAHFAGGQTAANVLRANPNAPVTDFFAPSAIAANPTVLGNGQTAGGLAQWAGRRMGMGGQSGPAPITVETEAQRSRDRDYLENLRLQLAATSDLTDAERVRQAGLRALREAQNAGLSEQAALEASALARAEEQKKVDQEKLARQRAISEQVASDRREAGRQTENLARQQADIDEQTRIRLERIAQARREGIPSIEGRTLNQIESEIRADGERLKQRAELEFRERELNAVLEQRRNLLAQLNEQYQVDSTRGQADPLEYMRAVNAVLEQSAPRIRELAEGLANFAKGVDPSLQGERTSAAIARAQGAGNDDAVIAQSAAQRVLNDAERAYNDLLATRASKLSVIRAELERGNITRDEAEQREKNLYEDTQPLIETYLAKKRELLEVLRQSNQLTQQQYDLEVAGLERVAAESARVDERMNGLRESVEGAFTSSAMNAFDTFARGLAEGKSAIESLGAAFRQFASDFLSQIARMIMQQLIFNALQSLSGGGGGGGIFGTIASAIGRVGAPVRHGGGMVGSSSQTRTVSPAWFANAMRYHSGGIVGLRPDEEAAILQTGEEVLSRNDPRNRMNGGGGASVFRPTIINTIDPTEVLSAALGTPGGEKALINAIRMNKRAVQGALG